MTTIARLDALTGLRWWAAFAVFLFHVQVFAPLPSDTVAFALDLGNYGVDFFFVLSGFVLTWSWRSSMPISTFYTNRVGRIYPSHFVALLLAIPVFYSFAAPSAQQWWIKQFDGGTLLLSVPLLQGWSRDTTVLFSGNPAAWTLSCEFLFYALHPLLVRLLARCSVRGALITAIASLAAFGGLQYAINATPGTWLGSALPFPLLTLPEFVIGAALGWAFRVGWRPRITIAAALMLVAVVALAIVAGSAFLPDTALTHWLNGYVRQLVTLVCAVLICATAAADLAGRARAFNWKPIVKLGEWSFTFYLLHATAIYLVLDIWSNRPAAWSNVLWFAPALAVGIAAAAGLHYWVERPAERAIRRWKAKRDVVVA